MGVFAEPSGLDPVVAQGGGTGGNHEMGAIYDTLMRIDPEGCRPRRVAGIEQPELELVQADRLEKAVDMTQLRLREPGRDRRQLVAVLVEDGQPGALVDRPAEAKGVA